MSERDGHTPERPDVRPGGEPIPELRLAGRRVVVAGLARTGLATARFLLSRGALVTVSDRREEPELVEAAREVRSLGAELDLGAHSESVFRRADLIVLSPGVPASLPVLEAAALRGVPVISEVELAWRFLKGRIAGITGSNGKSTTTALAGAMLSAAGLPAKTCGNIGTPLISLVEEDTPDTVYALELSSFQLEATVRFRAEAAVLLNLSPDHLDRHVRYEDYIAAKAKIFTNQKAGDVAIVNAADEDARRAPGGSEAALLQFSASGPVTDGAFVRGDEIVLASAGQPTPLVEIAEVPLAGRHNLENVMAAALAARHLGAPLRAIREAVTAARSLPHRLEPVGTVAGVEWFNDSKATNVDAALRALEAFPGRRVWVILGGRDKGGDFSVLRETLENRASAVLLIGEAAEVIEAQLSGVVACVRAGDLENAVDEARSGARAGDVVLLAPACASFDAYRNYEERGEHFRRLVRGLPGFTAPAPAGGRQ